MPGLAFQPAPRGSRIGGSIEWPRKQNDKNMAKCNYDPRPLLGQPIGMFHCPECGAMVVAGCAHPDPDHKIPDCAECGHTELVHYANGTCGEPGCNDKKWHLFREQKS